MEATQTPVLFDLEAIQPSEETYDRNSKLKRNVEDRCAICNRPVVIKDNTAWVHMTGNLKLYPNSITAEMVEADREQYPAGTMYSFPVGPECAKKIPADYRS